MAPSPAFEQNSFGIQSAFHVDSDSDEVLLPPLLSISCGSKKFSMSKVKLFQYISQVGMERSELVSKMFCII